MLEIVRIGLGFLGAIEKKKVNITSLFNKLRQNVLDFIKY